MGSRGGHTVHYSCVFDGKEKLHSYNNGGQEMESLSDLCLQHTPHFHAWYFHSTRGRTYGFLVDPNYTYFVIADSSIPNSELLGFLRFVRDRFMKSSKNSSADIIAVISKMVLVLENSPRLSSYDDILSEKPPQLDGSTSSEAPLLGKSGPKHDMKNTKDRAVDVNGTDVPIERIEANHLQRSTNSSDITKKLWVRYLKIVIVVDVLLCLFLFGIWLAVCDSFRCLSG